MKILKIVFLTLIAVIVLFLGISAMMPDESKVERSIVVNAPVETVFNEVNDFNNWDHWSPWKDYDPEMKNVIEGAPGAPGHKMSWSSNNPDVGAGSLTRITTSPNSEIENNLTFAGYDAHSRNLWKFENVAEGTRVTWTNIMPLPIYMRLMAGKMEEMMAPDFEKGLQRIKSVCESMPQQSTMKIEETTVPAADYLAVRTSADAAAISAKLGEAYGTVMTSMKTQGLNFAGPVFAIYYSASETGFDFEAGIPVDKKGKDDGNVKAGTRYGGKVIVADYYGSYEGLVNAHTAIDEYVKKNNKQVAGPPWEEYVTDPVVEKDTAKWLSKVYYPIQ